MLLRTKRDYTSICRKFLKLVSYLLWPSPILNLTRSLYIFNDEPEAERLGCSFCQISKRYNCGGRSIQTKRLHRLASPTSAVCKLTVMVVDDIIWFGLRLYSH